MKKVSLIIIGFFVLVGGCVEGEKIESMLINERPNIILITISSLRADHVGCMGYERDTTPNFDEFARDGVLFERVYATSSWQMPAVGSIFTGKMPKEHGATHINNKLKDECRTIAEILKEKGYFCAGFSCNPRLKSENGFGQGFDMYDDYSVEMMLESLNFGGENKVNINQARTNDLINDAVIRWIEKNAHPRFFLFVHYYDTHWDYLPPGPYDKMFSDKYEGDIDGKLISKEPLYSNRPSDEDVQQIIALYDGEIRATDEDLGELLEVLDDNGLMSKSVFIIMGDHGEQFYEHGNTSHHGLYEELLRVPMAVSVPGGEKGVKFDGLVSGFDVMGMMLEYAGIEPPKNKVKDVVFAEYSGGAIEDSFAGIGERYKYYYKDGQGGVIFDLEEDAGEIKPIKDNFNDEMKKLKEMTESLYGDKMVKQPSGEK